MRSRLRWPDLRHRHRRVRLDSVRERRRVHRSRGLVRVRLRGRVGGRELRGRGFDILCRTICDYLTTPDLTRGGSECPQGAILSPGDSVGWASNGNVQGSVGSNIGLADNGCTAKGTCALPFSLLHGLGGGWQICFA